MPLSAEHMLSEPVLVYRDQAKVGERNVDGSYVSNMAAPICFAPWRSICDRRLVASAMSTMLFEVRHQFQQEIKTLRPNAAQDGAPTNRGKPIEGSRLRRATPSWRTLASNLQRFVRVPSPTIPAHSATPLLETEWDGAPAEVKGTTAVRLRRPELMSNNGQLASFIGVGLADGQARCGMEQKLGFGAAVWKARHSLIRTEETPNSRTPLSLHARRRLNLWQPPAFTLHKWWSLGDNELQIRR
ncbi:hypothetical protein NMY22_g9316 [Coprinellus aureogranulatus]|nr:hypothetical protein NMY22_g9316 [Coprinellus aureogranulatus]